MATRNYSGDTPSAKDGVSAVGKGRTGKGAGFADYSGISEDFNPASDYSAATWDRKQQEKAKKELARLFGGGAGGGAGFDPSALKDKRSLAQEERVPQRPSARGGIAMGSGINPYGSGDSALAAGLLTTRGWGGDAASALNARETNRALLAGASMPFAGPQLSRPSGPSRASGGGFGTFRPYAPGPKVLNEYAQRARDARGAAYNRGQTRLDLELQAEMEKRKRDELMRQFRQYLGRFMGGQTSTSTRTSDTQQLTNVGGVPIKMPIHSSESTSETRPLDIVNLLSIFMR